MGEPIRPGIPLGHDDLVAMGDAVAHKLGSVEPLCEALRRASPHAGSSRFSRRSTGAASARSHRGNPNPARPRSCRPSRTRAQHDGVRRRSTLDTTNPDDCARIAGKKGERIVYIRTLIKRKDGTEPGRSIATANTAQYL